MASCVRESPITVSGKWTTVNHLAGGGATHLLSPLLGHLPLVVHVAFVSQNHPLHVGSCVLQMHTTRVTEVAALAREEEEVEERVRRSKEVEEEEEQ